MGSKIQQLLQKPFLRFLIVGGGAFAAEYLSFIVMYYALGIWLILANGLSFGAGLGTSFSLNRAWTFGHKEYKKATTRQLSYYVTLAILNLLATLIIVSYLKHLGLAPKFGKLLAMVITSSWNFVLFKNFVFNHKKITKLK